MQPDVTAATDLDLNAFLESGFAKEYSSPGFGSGTVLDQHHCVWYQQHIVSQIWICPNICIIWSNSDSGRENTDDHKFEKLTFFLRSGRLTGPPSLPLSQKKEF